MPLQKKLISLGRSRVVSIPKTWLTLAEEKEGKKIIAIAMEVDGCLTLNPIFEKELKASVSPARRTTPAQEPVRILNG
jgi:hypothetical protein